MTKVRVRATGTGKWLSGKDRKHLEQLIVGRYFGVPEKFKEEPVQDAAIISFDVTALIEAEDVPGFDDAEVATARLGSAIKDVFDQISELSIVALS